MRSTLFAVALVAAVASAGVLIAMAQAAQMNPPVMTAGVAAAIDVSWQTVPPVGENVTTYTLSYDTAFPFTATQTITTVGTSTLIAGVPGTTYYAFVQADDGSGVLSDPSAVAHVTASNTPMDPPTMLPAAGGAIDVSWLPVDPIGSNPTTYTLTYDTSDPFTSPLTIVTTDTTATISGVDGVTYFAMIQADDGSGTLSDPSALAQATADGAPPVSTFSTFPASPNGAHGWYTSAAATITVEETGTGLQTLIVNGVDVSADFPIALPPDPSFYPAPLVEGVNNFDFFGTDVAGNVESPDVTAQVKLDSVAPTCALIVSSSGPTSQTITATITAGDAAPGSGVDQIQYTFLPQSTTPTGGTVWTSASGASTVTTAPEGRLTLFARSLDVAGNMSGVQSADVFFDATAPSTALVTVPGSPTGPSGTWLHAPTLSLVVTDVDPSTTTFYSWNNPDTINTVGTVPVVPSGVGTQTLRYFSVDTAGNVEGTHVATFFILGQQSYTITPSAGAHGAISPATAQVLSGGTEATFTMIPDSGYHVADVLVDGVSVGTGTTYHFGPLTSDHTISVTFSALPTFAIVATAGSGGAISPSGTQNITTGFDATFTITPDPGHHIVSVLVDGNPAGAIGSYTFHNVTAAHTISATFAIDTFSIITSAGAGGAISPSGTRIVDWGTTTTFTITPVAGYHIVNVFVDTVSVGASATVVFSDVTRDHTLSVTFALTTVSITPSAGFGGSIAPSIMQTLLPGSDATFSIRVNSGFYVLDVLVDGVSVGPVSSYTFHNVTTAHTISATFHAKVVTSLTMNTSHSTVTHGHTDYFFGVLTPTMANGQHVKFYVRRPGSSVYRLVSTRHTFNGHHWNYTYRLSSRGTYYFKVVFDGTRTATGRTSRTIHVHAR
jgi:hypothetical protein